MEGIGESVAGSWASFSGTRKLRPPRNPSATTSPPQRPLEKVNVSSPESNRGSRESTDRSRRSLPKPHPRATRGHRTGRRSSENEDIEEEKSEDESRPGSSMQGDDEDVRVVKTTAASLLAQQEEGSVIMMTSPVFFSGGGGSKKYWTCVSFVLPRHRTKAEWDQWGNMTFSPSSLPALDSRRDEEEGRSEEGIFIGEPVPIAKRNWNLLYSRILKQSDGDQWFGPDGKLLCSVSPYREVPTQLLLDSSLFEGDEDGGTCFVPIRHGPIWFPTQRRGKQSLYQLELGLGFVHFSHHPYFSQEHVLASVLQKLFENYSNRRQKQITERTVNKLNAMRDAVKHLKQSLDELKNEVTSEEDPNRRERLLETLGNTRRRLKSYRRDMRQASLLRDQGYWEDKASILAVLDSWKEVKELREAQGYTNTSLKLSIVHLPSDPNEELNTWVKDMEEDLQDLKEESEEIYEDEMLEYRAKMKHWVGKGRKIRKQSVGSGNATDDSQASNHKERPKQPERMSGEHWMKAIEQSYKDIRRRPGEPNIVLELTNTAQITPTNNLPEGTLKEKQRRDALKKCRLVVCVWVNGNELYSSKPKLINHDFVVFLAVKIPIKLPDKPEVLEIDLMDLETRIRTPKIQIQLPHLHVTMEMTKLRQVMFAVDDVVKVNTSGVGSGVAFSINGKDYGAKHTKGSVSIHCGWVAQEDKKGEQQGYGSADFIRKLSTMSLADPNNPQSNYSKKKYSPATLETIQDFISDVEVEDTEQVSILDGLMKEFDFCDTSVIEKSARFKVLQLRDAGVSEFKNIKMIPNNDKHISPDLLSNYEKRRKNDTKKKASATKGGVLTALRHQVEDDFVHESNRLEKIREIRLQILELFEKSLKQIAFEDLVVEEQIPDIGTLGLNLISFFQPRRPLRPMRKERKRVQASNLVDTKIDLVFNVVRAFNLPLRKDSSGDLMSTESLTGVQLQRNKRVVERRSSTLRPLVEVWFQRKKVRTTTALGSNPTWNQELQINLTVPNDDYSQNNLIKMDDMMYLLVYDEIPVDLQEDDRRRETDIHQRFERHWLGSITIPFSTLYTNGRIEGTFMLNVPPVLLGYEAQAMTSSVNVGGFPIMQQPPSKSNNQTSACLTIFITLHPAVQPNITTKEDSATGESAELLSFAKNWKNLFERRFADRIVRPFVMTADGETILCTRYLTPIEPPELFLAEDLGIIQKMEMLAHYVSLFPSVRDSTLGIADYNLWIDSSVFIQTPGGGIDDHAVLLACYFMYLKMPCWIVQGNSIPDGPTTFVLTSFKTFEDEKAIPKEMKNSTLMWNPCTGHCYNVSDNFCPLQKVWSLVGKQNIWANAGLGERPSEVDWNVGKSKSWLPLFAKTMPEDKIPCVQHGIKRYKPADQNQANSLAQRVERALRDAFMSWRVTSKTNWNRYCSAILRRLLTKLEAHKSGKLKHSTSLEAQGSTGSISSGSVVTVNEEHLAELREVTTSYQMSGFPLQLPYTNMQSIVELVYATGLHMIDTPDVEFALAAYAHAYPSSVYSVWVYLAALHKRK